MSNDSNSRAQRSSGATAESNGAGTASASAGQRSSDCLGSDEPQTPRVQFGRSPFDTPEPRNTPIRGGRSGGTGRSSTGSSSRGSGRPCGRPKCGGSPCGRLQCHPKCGGSHSALAEAEARPRALAALQGTSSAQRSAAELRPAAGAPLLSGFECRSGWLCLCGSCSVVAADGLPGGEGCAVGSPRCTKTAATQDSCRHTTG